MRIMTEFQKKFGKRLKELKKLKGLTDLQLAEKIGVEEKTVNYWINGHNAITFNKLPLIAKALDIPVYSLFVFDDDINVTSLGALSEKDEKILREVIKLFLSK